MEEDKICSYCGLPFSWRKKWQKNWSDIKICSDRCRKSKNTKLDNSIEQKIIELLKDRGFAKSICPSEVARAIFENEDRWRNEMERVRCAARRLADSGIIALTQQSSEVAPHSFKGPIRLRLKKS